MVERALLGAGSHPDISRLAAETNLAARRGDPLGTTMKILFACAASAAFAGVALIGAPAALAAPEDDFLTVITNGGITWPSDKTAQVVETGHAVCEDWSNGATFEQEVADLTSVTDWSDYQAGYFVGAATGAFCPEFEWKVS